MEALIVLILVLVLAWGLFRNAGKGVCRECGQRVNAKAKVCPYCGNRFDQAPAE